MQMILLRKTIDDIDEIRKYPVQEIAKTSVRHKVDALLTEARNVLQSELAISAEDEQPEFMLGDVYHLELTKCCIIDCVIESIENRGVPTLYHTFTYDPRYADSPFPPTRSVFTLEELREYLKGRKKNKKKKEIK